MGSVSPSPPITSSLLPCSFLPWRGVRLPVHTTTTQLHSPSFPFPSLLPPLSVYCHFSSTAQPSMIPFRPSHRAASVCLLCSHWVMILTSTLQTASPDPILPFISYFGLNMCATLPLVAAGQRIYDLICHFTVLLSMFLLRIFSLYVSLCHCYSLTFFLPCVPA